ncbi:MAG: hypothetical protein HY040_16725 [Planctomycetes bacterium]|nr:hypothetical protein [Planctomycetota bacterium]
MVEKGSYRILACSILPEHVPLVIGRFRYRVETMIRLLKAEATMKLKEDGRHPMAAWPQKDGSLHTPWAERCWKVYLDTAEDVHRSIKYVEDNALKEGKPKQRWSFVVPFEP